jgi:TolB-like protein/Tfp pilus assembly protein PilF
MSPEQAVGQAEVDARSDVYALGCVVYEMVAGRAPFEGDTPQALLAKHAVERAPSLRSSDPQVPLFLEGAVERALAKDPADRFPTASEFAGPLTAEMVVARVGRRRWSRRAVVGAMVAVVVAAAAWGLLTVLGGPAYERLAVLPPTNLMNDPEQEYFVQGVHHALISELQQAGVTVIARTSVLQYANTEKPAREIASELDVDALIEASVLRAADSVEIQVAVVDGRTQEYVGDPIVRGGEFRNVVVLYRELTGAIAAEIQTALTPQAEAHLASARTVNPQAYEAYLRGKFYAEKMTPPNLATALQYFELARDIDPDYALAHAGIGLVWQFRKQMGVTHSSEAAPHAREAAERALALDSTLVEVQYTSALVKAWTDWDWEAAEAAFRRAIELNPNFPDVRAFYAHFLGMMRRQYEAIPQIERAVEQDPFNPFLQGLYGWLLYRARRYDEAIAQFQSVLRIDTNNPMAQSGLQKVYVAQGLYEEAVAVTRALWTHMGFVEMEEALARGAAAGEYREALRSAADYVAALASEMYVPPVEVAGLYAMAGEDSLALDWLERAFEERDPDLPYLSVEPHYDGFREDPRFLALLRRMNLPD